MAASTATLAFPGWEHKATLSAATPTGTLYVTPEGNVAVYQGLKAGATNDAARFDNAEVYDISNDNSVAFSEGATVYLDGNNNPAATGLVRVGRAAATNTSSQPVRVRLYRDNSSVKYSSVAASTAVTNTTTETTFDTNVTCPANYLKAGDVIRVRLQGIAPATNSTDTLNVKLYVGSVNIAATGAVDVSNNDIFYIEADITVRTVGASGTIVATGVTALGTAGTVTAKPFYLASATLDTTAAAIIKATATWSVASSSDSCRLDVVNVQLIRA